MYLVHCIIVAVIASSAIGGKISEAKKCHPVTDKPPPKCGFNEVAVKCKSTCPQNCDISYTEYICPTDAPCEPGCDCIKDHLRNSSNICIPNEECPPPPTATEPNETVCGPNEKFSECKIFCPPQSCKSKFIEYECANPPCVAGCDCIDGFLRNDNGTCILNTECPLESTEPTEPVCGPKEKFSECKITCPPQSCRSKFTEYSCIADRTCEAGCDCVDGFLRNDNGTCIQNEKCPSPSTEPTEPVCGPNEKFSECKIICPPQSCRGKFTKYACIANIPCEAGCDCVEGFLRNDNGTCIPSKKCPPASTEPTEPVCGPNEKFSECKIICPPQSCRGKFTKYACIANIPCEAGCDCVEGFLRNDNGTCIPSKKCPPASTEPTEPVCGPNEKFSECKIKCPPQSCRSKFAKYACIANIPCEAGCDCVDGFLRNNNGTCIPSKKCPPAGSTPTSPLPTCAVPNPQKCSDSKKPTTNLDGWECEVGYILSEIGGKCIKIEECPQDASCNGDPHARINACPWPCPSTCSSPNASTCDKKCEVGCQCESGYILCEKSGKCVLPEKCKGGNPCGINGTFIDCTFRCPNQYCPEDDSLNKVACKPGRPCPSGCGCKPGYRRKSYAEDDVCVLASDCTPVDCSRPNEVWDPCSSECLAERCEDVGVTQSECYSEECQPRCVCKKDFFRDANGVCVPVKECGNESPTHPIEPVCGPNEKFSECKIVCPPQTCDSIHTDYACVKQPCKPGCDCIDGYLRDANGTCTNNCGSVPTHPAEPLCGPNEKYSECKIVCPPQTCDSILTSYACAKQPCKPGCDCIDGYLRDANGICTNDCGSGGGNVTPKPTKKPCSSSNSSGNSHSSAQSGSSSQSSSSIATSSSNSHSSSSSSSASSSSSSSTKKTHTDPKKRCHNEENDCQPTCAKPNPKNCTASKGECEDGYILLKKGGKCIKIEDCPKGCNGDPNAVAKTCPQPCPSTCSEPNAFPCKRKCEPLGCQCAFGYLLDENDKCIAPDQCPGGNPCRANETFVACRSGCPTDYCPTSDSRAIVICETYPFGPCFSGCVCKVNHKKLSREDDQCILSSECPPVECTRQNEEWNSCPSDCLEETCESANSEPVQCNTLLLNCQPRCTCKKNYFRNETDICIPAKDCKKY